MSRLIFVSGASGGGKTHAVSALPETVFRMHADRLQYDAVRRAFPFVRAGREYDWFVWPRDLSTVDLVRLLDVCLAGLYPGLIAHRGAVVIEGAILVNEWFRAALQHVLIRFGHRFEAADVHCLFLDLPAPVLFDRIHARAREHANRQAELARYPNVASVERLRHLHISELAPGRWELLRDNGALSSRLDELIA
jgi:ribose 1,5-bisphosphokinase PhnN